MPIQRKLNEMKAAVVTSVKTTERQKRSQRVVVVTADSAMEAALQLRLITPSVFLSAAAKVC